MNKNSSCSRLSGASWTTLHKDILPVQCCPKSIKTTMYSSFVPLGQNCTRTFYLCSVVLRVLRQHWTVFLPVQVVSSLLDNIAQGFYLCIVVPRVLRQHWTVLFPVQCCPKIINTMLNSIFSGTVLSQASWTTLHKGFTCAMLFQEY